MLRLLLLLVIALPGLSSLGCRACSNCSDYSPPVANCDCAYCNGGARVGSTVGVYPEETEVAW